MYTNLLPITKVYAEVIDGSDISQIADMLARAFNLFLMIGGTVFLIMILWSAYKYAMALGDPKMLEGAKQSLTYAIFGFVVVLGFYTIITFAASYFGVAGEPVFGDPAGLLKQNIIKLQDIVQESGGGIALPGSSSNNSGSGTTNGGGGGGSMVK